MRFSRIAKRRPIPSRYPGDHPYDVNSAGHAGGFGIHIDSLAGSGIEKANRAEIMFDVLMTLLVILSFGFPVMPWFFGARWGSRGIWLSTGFAVVILLCFFPILFWVACGACGQGAMAIFVLGPIWIVSALVMVSSAALAHYKRTLISAGPRRRCG